MSDYTNSLKAEFERHADAKIAISQKAYMKNQFEFYGITAPMRREIQKPFLVSKYLPKKKELEKIIKELWGKPEREFQMFGLDLVNKYKKYFEVGDIVLLEYMVTRKSWWDTVDFITIHLIGKFFKIYPKLKKKYVKKWLASNSLWLQRSALLFQHNYKEKVDTKLLVAVIKPLLGSKEFFINKAIGWMLRQYSKTDPKWVMDFASRTKLQSLSRKEALRLIKNG